MRLLLNTYRFINETEGNMKGDTVIRQEGINLLIEKLGIVDAERFFSLIIREPFDYTKWRKNLFEDFTVKRLSEDAMGSITGQKHDKQKQ